MLRSDSAEWADSTVPAARTGCWLFQHLPVSYIPCEPAKPPSSRLTLKRNPGVGFLSKKSRELVKYYQPWLIIGLDREESRYVHKNHENQSSRLPRGRRCPVAARRNGIRRLHRCGWGRSQATSHARTDATTCGKRPPRRLHSSSTKHKSTLSAPSMKCALATFRRKNSRPCALVPMAV